MVDIAAIKSKDQGDKKAAAKVVKFKLTKDQALFVEGFVKHENRIAVCREYLALWTQYFRFFADELQSREITAEEEKGFFQLSTVLARKHFQFVELMGDCFEKGPDIVNLLATGTNLATLQGMQEQTLAKFQLDWHTLFLEMNKGLGRLLRMLPGNMTLSEALATLDKVAPAAPAKATPAKAAPAPAKK